MFNKLTGVLCAPDEGDQGGAGGAGPAVDNRPDAGAPPADDKAAAELAALKAERDKLKADKEAADKAAAKKKAEADKAAAAEGNAELAKLREEIQQLRGDALREARGVAFERLGVLPEYRDLIPGDFDPRTADGAKALETFVSERPAMTRSRVPEPPKLDLSGWHPKAAEAAKKGNNPLITRQSLEAMESHRRSHQR